jgi:uncharacterized RDD family membrane protein YckC
MYNDGMSKIMDENIIGKRIWAFLIDAVIWVLIFIIFSIATGQTDTTNGVYFYLNGLPFVAYLLLGIIYGTVMEMMYGGTIGKLALSITVVNDEGNKLSLKQSFIRNIMRFVDGFPYFIPYLVGLVAVATSPTKQRLGDRLAHTYVVKPE